jgi:membrane protease YdiL (CAAX protease family)
MARYGACSRSAYYGVIAALPLLVAYEALLFWTGIPAVFQVRNAADVWLRTLLESLGAGPAQATAVTLRLLLLAIPLTRPADMPLVPRYFAWVTLEAGGYSAALFAVSLLLPLAGLTPAALPPGTGTGERIALALGAGLFEELAFRVILVTVLLWLARLVFRPRWAAALAVLGAALLFSLAHYVGSYGEPFLLYSFAFRWAAGLVFTLLYAARGFAVTAYTHALYDLWTLLV